MLSASIRYRSVKRTGTVRLPAGTPAGRDYSTALMYSRMQLLSITRLLHYGGYGNNKLMCFMQNDASCVLLALRLSARSLSKELKPVIFSRAVTWVRKSPSLPGCVEDWKKLDRFVWIVCAYSTYSLALQKNSLRDFPSGPIILGLDACND